MNTRITALEKLLDGPRDSALLRYSLGNEWLHAGEPAKAAECFRSAIALDRKYSAAWKLLGKALTAADRPKEAIEAYNQGIVIAEERGDVQAAREMLAFTRRLKKSLGEEAG